LSIPTEPIFHHGWGALPPHFAGRRKERDKILRMISSGSSVPLLIGRRGVGKTCLIKNIIREVTEEGWIVLPKVWATAGDKSMTAPQAANLIMSCAVTYHRLTSPPIQVVPAEIGFDRPNHLPESNTDLSSSMLSPMLYSLELTRMFEDSGARGVADVVSQALQYLVTQSNTHKGLIIVLDEFHLYGAKNEYSPINMIAHIITFCRELGIPCRFILAGMPIAQVILEKHLGGGIDLINSIYIDHLSFSETIEAIELPLKQAGVTFDKALLERIYQDTTGHPKLVQYFSQSVIDLCRRGDIYTIDQYREVQRKIEDNFFESTYQNVISIPPVRLEVLRACARASVWRAEEDNHATETCLFSPKDILLFINQSASRLNEDLRILMLPGNEYIYKADRGKYGFLKPLLWKYLLRLKGEEVLIDAFPSGRQQPIGPKTFKSVPEARIWLKKYISDSSEYSQRIYIIDEYWSSECVDLYLESVNSHTSIYIFSHFNSPGKEYILTKNKLTALRKARKGRVFWFDQSGGSHSIFFIKGRYILCVNGLGIQSSESFKDIGNRPGTVSILTNEQHLDIMELIEKKSGYMVEITIDDPQ